MRRFITILVTTCYVSVVFVRPPHDWNPVGRACFDRPKAWLLEFIGRFLTSVGIADASSFQRNAAYFLFVQLFVPWIAMLLVGRGRMKPEQMAEVLERRDRKAAGPTAAAHGLTLVSVSYPAKALGWNTERRAARRTGIENVR